MQKSIDSLPGPLAPREEREVFTVSTGPLGVVCPRLVGVGVARRGGDRLPFLGAFDDRIR